MSAAFERLPRLLYDGPGQTLVIGPGCNLGCGRKETDAVKHSIRVSVLFFPDGSKPSPDGAWVKLKALTREQRRNSSRLFRILSSKSCAQAMTGRICMQRCASIHVTAWRSAG
jgi:hypothetical protein